MGRALAHGARTGGSGYAIGWRRPKPALPHHCNRDNQYAAREYREKFDQHGLLAPMSRKGGCWDNATMERFFGSLESEWTNSDRLHSFFDYTTPRKRNWPLLRKRCPLQVDRKARKGSDSILARRLPV